VARLADIRKLMQSYTECFDASAVSANDALLGVRDAAAIENMAAALKANLAARVSDTELWRTKGDRSAAHLLAREAGTTVGQAKDALDTAARLRALPAADAATRRGELSSQQSSAIADAAAVDPAAEKTLLGQVRAGASLAETRDEAARIKAAATPDLEARRKKIHAERYLRTFTDGEGAGNLRMRDNPEVIARIMARVDEVADEIFYTAYREGRREPRQAYAADALARLVRGDAAPSKGGARPKIVFRVDWEAWLRGYPQSGEVMELVGYGPVAASAVDDAINVGGFIAAVITKGQRLTGVAHLSRKPTAKQQSALEWLYPTCAAMGCFAVARLERDHRFDWAATHVTMLDWLDLLCSHHHDLKTQQGWALAEGTGKRAFVAADDPRHPSNANAPPVAAM
jgi:hypothetical protein